MLPLPAGHDAATVADAVIEHLGALPGWFARTLTWDRGSELAQPPAHHRRHRHQVYFADPYAPWQRGSNENINGLLREYLPKGTDLSLYTPAQLQPSPTNSTTGPASASATTPPARNSLNSSTEDTRCDDPLNTPPKSPARRLAAI